MFETTLIVPCFNEASRIRPDDFLALAREADIHLLFVDDGSTDHTSQRISELAGRSEGRVRLVRLERNSGKGEAVRQGLLHAIREGATIVGYADADLSTPAEELRRLVIQCRQGPAYVLLGSRIRMLGTDITRRPLRHYLGRVFATGASLTLRLPVYDTQCGAKVFRVTSVLRAALENPFMSRWAFDVELLGRLLARHGHPGYTARDFLEVPLLRWADVRGSKLSLVSALRSGLELAGIAWYLRR